MSSIERKLRRVAEQRRTQQQYRHPMPIAYDPARFATVEDAVLVAARAVGCTCQPDIFINGDRVAVCHDDWCALLRRLEDRN